MIPRRNQLIMPLQRLLIFFFLWLHLASCARPVRFDVLAGGSLRNLFQSASQHTFARILATNEEQLDGYNCTNFYPALSLLKCDFPIHNEYDDLSVASIWYTQTEWNRSYVCFTVDGFPCVDAYFCDSGNLTFNCHNLEYEIDCAKIDCDGNCVPWHSYLTAGERTGCHEIGKLCTTQTSGDQIYEQCSYLDILYDGAILHIETEGAVGGVPSTCSASTRRGNCTWCYIAPDCPTLVAYDCASYSYDDCALRSCDHNCPWGTRAPIPDFPTPAPDVPTAAPQILYASTRFPSASSSAARWGVVPVLWWTATTTMVVPMMMMPLLVHPGRY